MLFMSSIKWIVSDLDGTLLGFDEQKHFVLPQAFNAIKKAIAKGAIFSVATGRSYPDALGIISPDQAVKHSARWIVSCNGSVIYDQQTNQVVRKMYVSQREGQYVFDLVQLLRNQRLSPIVAAYYPDGNMAIEKDGYNRSEFIAFFNRCNGHFSEIKITPTEDVFSEANIVKYVVFFPPWNQGGYKYGLTVAAELDLHKRGTISSEFAIEFNPIGVSKGEALAWLAPRIKQNLETTLVIGDSGNDKTMLKAAKYSVCPASSAASVKECAKTVIDAAPSLIVAQAIEHHLNLIGK